MNLKFDELKFQRKSDLKDKKSSYVDIRLDIQKLFDTVKVFKEALKSKDEQHDQILAILAVIVQDLEIQHKLDLADENDK